MLKRSLLFVVLGFWMGNGLCGEGIVSSPKRRDTLLQLIEQVVSAKPMEYPPLPDARKSPFMHWQDAEETVTENVEVDSEVVPEPEVAVRLTDDVALPVIAANFKASGSFIISNRRMIRLKSGTLISEGSAINARIGEETYTVIVSKVDSDAYVLTLGNASVTRSFGESNLNNGSINRGGDQ